MFMYSLLPMIRSFALGMIFLAACQDYGVHGDDTTGGTAPVAPTVFHVVVYGSYSGLWTDEVIDRSRSCMVATDAGKDYRACCPAGFTPFGFPAFDGDFDGWHYDVNCVEDVPNGPRAILYLSDPDASGDQHADLGTWTSGVYVETHCASDVVDDALSQPVPNPPDDYSACCPEGFSAVGQGQAEEFDSVVCLQDAKSSTG
jgi:hypothetical protein